MKLLKFSILSPLVILITVGMFQNCSGGFETLNTNSSLKFDSDGLLSLASYTQNPLQNSCYCIDCSASEIQALSGLECKHIRWGRFPWNPWENGSGSVNAVFEQSVNQRISSSVVAAKQVFGSNVSFEFGIPEYFHSNYRQLQVSNSEMEVVDRYLRAQIPNLSITPASSTPFANMPVGDRADFTNPQMDSVPGLRWHFFLGKQAIDSGAGSIYISQVNIRFASPSNTSYFIGLIKALRAYAQENYGRSLIVGAESIEHLSEPYKGAFQEQIQYVKFITDTDVALLSGGKWVVQRKEGSKIDCLGQDLLDPSHPAKSNSKGQLVGQLCVSAPDNGQLREFNSLGYRGASFLSDNRYKIPVVLELDGCQACDWTNGSLTHSSSQQGHNNVVFYKHHGFESGSTCHSRVRNGLTTTMQFLSQPKWVRDEFQKYMVRLAYQMTQQTGVPTYFPRLVKVDQNHFWQIDGATLSRASEQKSLLRQCPANDDGPGISGVPMGLHFVAKNCDNLDSARETLRSDFLNIKPSHEPPISQLPQQPEEPKQPELPQQPEEPKQPELPQQPVTPSHPTYGSCVFNGQMIQHGQSVKAYQASAVPHGSTCWSQTRTCHNGVLSGTYAYASCSTLAANSCTFAGQTIAHGQSVTAYNNDVVPAGSSCKSQTRTCNNGTLSGSYFYKTCAVSNVPVPTDVDLTREYEAVVIGALENVLGRPRHEAMADRVGIDYWVGRMKAGMTAQQLSQNLKASDEYFVRKAYKDILRRSPVQSEVAYYIGQLSAGKMSRSQITAHFNHVCANKIGGECS